MYQFQKRVLQKKQSIKYTLSQENEQLQYIDFITFLQRKKTFRSFFLNLLSDIPFHAYQWETPPVASSTLNQPFEFAVTNNPRIDLPPDTGPFRQYFSDDDVATFNNLGSDAKLIAPAPVGNLNYSHIGVFTENAPEQQQHSLTVGKVAEEQISDQPLWLNTAGGGVAWLHVRLDSRPKYYRHKPYTSYNSAT